LTKGHIGIKVSNAVSKFFIPANKPEDWKSLLAEPSKHWRTGYSAKSLSYCWQEANDFPPEVRGVFQDSGISVFKGIKMLVAFPEYKVPLPGGKRASQSDIFILAKGDCQLISITVEGKVDEPFGEIISEWKLKDMGGKEERLAFLCDQLMLRPDMVNNIHYQLLHRTASAIIEAKKFNAPIALMLVHAFEKTKEKYDESLQAYCRFLELFGKHGEENSIAFIKDLDSIDLYCGWVRGNNKYLEK
jgi:hypothetical protein